MRVSLLLFYLLLFFLPTQLSRHFFFDFTQISGIRSDYLMPTIYLTDILAFLLIIFTQPFWTSQNKKKNKTIILFLLFVVCYLLFNVLFIAVNKWAAFYKLAKIAEFIFLGIAISKLRPKLITIASILSISVFYTSIIAIWQFSIQKSIGGPLWWLGERTFYAATPGIAAFSWSSGELILRPYSTFPHPNVLGGFLAIILPVTVFILITKWTHIGKLLKTLFIVSFITGTTALILSFSRAAWLVSLVGLTGIFLEKKFSLFEKIKTKKSPVIFIFYLLILASAIVPVTLSKNLLFKSQYLQERADLIEKTISMTSANQLLGVGLNNSIIQAQNYIKTFPGLYIFQPVHNIYLLVLAETGILGLSLFSLIWLMLFNRIFKSYPVFLYVFVQLFLLGLFDHYLITLQQGQLMFVIFSALSFIPKVAY